MRRVSGWGEGVWRGAKNRRWAPGREFFFFFFFYIIYSLLRDKQSHGALAMAKTKRKSQNELTKGNIRNTTLQLGVGTGPRPTYGGDIQTSTIKETLL